MQGNIVNNKIIGKIINNNWFGSIVDNRIKGTLTDYIYIPYVPPTGATYCAESLAYFARMDVQPSDALKTLLNNTIVAMIDAGIWDELDQFVFMNLHTAQASTLDVKGNIDHTWVNSPIWQAGVGVHGNGVSYENSHFIASNGNKYKLNDAGIYFFGNTDGYGFDGGANGYYYGDSIGHNTYDNYTRINSDYFSTFVGYAYPEGFNAYARIDAKNVIKRKEGVEYNFSSNSMLVSPYEYAIGTILVEGVTPAFTHTDNVKQYGFGSSMNLTKRAAFETILNNFNIAVFQTYGPELIANGTFDSPVGWDVGGGWSIHDGRLYSVDSTGFEYAYCYCAFDITKKYLVKCTVYDLVGTVRIGNGYAPWIDLVQGDNSIIYQPAIPLTAFYFQNPWAGDSCSIDNISVKEVTSI